MRCDDACTLLGAWHDGELGPWLTLRLRWHIRGCARCRREWNALDTLTDRLKAADPLAGFVLGLPAPAPRLRFARPGLALAATLLAVALVGGYQMQPDPLSPTVSVAQRSSDRVRPSGTTRPTVRTVTWKPGSGKAPSPLPKRSSVVARRTRRRARVVVAAITPSRRRSFRVTPVVPASKAPTMPTKIIQVSVKISDPQEVVRETRVAYAEAARLEAEREFIYVVATPEPVAVTVPALSKSVAEIETETDTKENL